MPTQAPQDEWTLEVQITEPDAEALAQFLKQAGFSDFRALAANDHEAYAMQAGAERVRKALADAGVKPR